ncbi:hypothetical protein ABKV19_027191, partial [Rosa sericea]
MVMNKVVLGFPSYPKITHQGSRGRRSTEQETVIGDCFDHNDLTGNNDVLSKKEITQLN